MVTWKKVVVSGSSAELATLKVDNLTSGSVVIGGGNTSNLSTLPINGTGNIVATTGATGVSMSGSFSGSFVGSITSASYAAFAATSTSSSFATQAANASSASFATSAANATSASYATFAATATSAATATNATSASYATFAATATSATTANTANSATSASYATFAATATSATTANSATSASYATFAATATSATTANSATSASYASFSATATSASFASQAANASSASYALTASIALNAGSTANSLTFSTGLSGSAISFNGGTAVSLVISGSSALSSNIISKWTGTGFTNSNITDTGTQIQIGSGASSGMNIAAGGLQVTGNSTFNSNLTVGGDLIVNGTASFVNADNLYVKDRFILINSGSTSLADAGIIAQYEASGNGSAIFLEAASAGTYGRWAVAYGVAPTATSVTADEFVVTAKINQAGAPSGDPTWGGATNGEGNIWVTNAGDIYIYS